jgi:hypothetical protein
VSVVFAGVWRRFDQRSGDIPSLAVALAKINQAFSTTSALDSIERFEAFRLSMGLEAPPVAPSDIPDLVAAVDPQRMGNSPVSLSARELTEILSGLVPGWPVA